MNYEKDSRSVDTTSYAYDTMLSVWTKIQTVLNGTEAMRSAGSTYLPQHSEESDKTYAERLGVTYLFNVSDLTLNSWVGRPFSDPIVLSEDMPESMSALLENVDMLGNNIDVFARNWFKDGVSKAISHVYVDMPRKIETQNGRVRTRADDNNENLRPYWISIRPEDLFFASSRIEKGVEKLTEIRIKEEVVRMDGFAEVFIPQIRRVFLTEEDGVRTGVVELYQLVSTKKKNDEWMIVDSYVFELDFIPLVTFYSDRRGFMRGKPPLEDLVDLNITHWQSASDQRAVLTVGRFAMLALSGGSDDMEKLTIGPKKWLFTPDPKAKYYYVEHEGKAIAAGETDLQNLESRMAEFGAEFLKKRPGGGTATARALDSAEATSPLQDMTIRFIDSVNLALQYTAAWINIDADKAGTVQITTEFGPEEVSGAELTVLTAARKQRDLSRENYLKELKRRGMLEDEFDIEANDLALEQEALSFQSGFNDDEEDGDEEEGEQGDDENKGGDDEEEE